MYIIILVFLLNSCLKTISFLDKFREKKLILKTEGKKRILIPSFTETFYPKEEFISSIRSGDLKFIYSQQHPLHLALYFYIHDKKDESFQNLIRTLDNLKDLKDLLPEENFKEYINGYDTKGLTPLHIAILSKESRVIDLVFEKDYGFEFDINTPTAYEKVTPLSLAISLKIDANKDMDDIIDKLISFGPKLGVLDKDNISELGYAALSNNLEVVKKIKENLNYQIKEEELSPLALAATNNNYEILVYLSNKENYQGWNNLKKLEFVSYIFKNTNLEGLREALKGQEILMTIEKYIEEYTNVKDIDGKTPLIYSIEFNNQENINKDEPNKNLNYDPNLIFKLCKSDNNYELIQNLLEQNINFIVKDFKNNNPLHIALKNNATKIASILIDKIGAQVINDKNSKGQTPLHTAVDNNNLLVKELLEKGADINMKDTQGNSVLHYAVTNEDVSMVSLLLESKDIKLDIKNEEGFTALDLADDPKITKLLESKNNLLEEIKEQLKTLKVSVDEMRKNNLESQVKTLSTLIDEIKKISLQAQIKDLSTLVDELKKIPLGDQLNDLSTLVEEIKKHQLVPSESKSGIQDLSNILKIITSSLEVKGPKELNEISDALSKQLKSGIDLKGKYKQEASSGIKKVEEYIELIKDANTEELKETGIEDREAVIKTLEDINKNLNQLTVE